MFETSIEISNKQQKFVKAVEYSRTYQNFYSKDSRFRFVNEKLINCLDNHFRYGEVIIDEHGEISIVHANNAHACHHRQCPVCQQRAYERVFAEAINNIPTVIDNYPTGIFAHLTLTVKNCLPELVRETVNVMSLALNRLLSLREVEKSYLGHIKQVQITEDHNGAAHPHFHVILHLKSSFRSHGYISKEKWATLWGKALKVDYSPQIGFSYIKEDSNRPLPEVVASTIAYAKKLSDVEFSRGFLYEMTYQMRYMRLTTPKGSLKSVVKISFVKSKANLPIQYRKKQRKLLGKFSSKTIH